MGRRSRIALAGALLSFALGLGCGRKSPELPEAQGRGAVDGAPLTKEPESIYDAQGRLKTSAERVEWLEIPMGFSRNPKSYGRHVLFEARGVPLDKARDFFAARMFTGQVEERDARVSYRAVMPITADGQAVRLDLHLSERTAENTLLLDIEPLTYGDAKPLSVQEAKKALSREQARAE